MSKHTWPCRKDARARRGFSLAEILVALSIIALLAAVLIPAVAGQIAKGDATRALQDMTAIRTGVEQFVADVHRYPQRLTHLTTAIDNTMKDVNGSNYPTSLTLRWKGPYLGRDAAGNFTTGFGAVTVDSLVKLTYQAGVNYVTVRLHPVLQTQFERLDLEVDGAVDAAAGLLRRDANDTVRYLIMPIQ